MRVRVMLLMLGVYASLGGVAAAQEQRVGITMGYPTAVGILWQVTERFALRPEVSLSKASADSTTAALSSSVSSSSSSRSWNASVSALIQIRRWDAVRAYVSPRFEYAHGRSTSTSSIVDFTNSNYSTGGAFGVQYSPAPHFGVFGETGLSYAHGKNSSSLSSTTTNNVSTRGGAGVIFFF